MASPVLLHSSACSFIAQFPIVSSPNRIVSPRNHLSLSVRACSNIVLVEKNEAEKANRLKTTYLEKIIPLLKDEFSYTNIHQVPKIDKIVVNCGIGEASQNAKGLDAAVNELALITGQRPVKTRAKNSIATFKLREGQPIGIAVTLRSDVMYSFLDRLINLGLPRTRDFQGVNPNSFDGHGNYSIGMKEQSVFPEISFDLLGKPRGMDVCITTTANTDKEAYRLLALMGMPFREGAGPAAAAAVRKKKLKSHHFDTKGRGKDGHDPSVSCIVITSIRSQFKQSSNVITPWGKILAQSGKAMRKTFLLYVPCKSQYDGLGSFGVCLRKKQGSRIAADAVDSNESKLKSTLVRLVDKEDKSYFQPKLQKANCRLI